MANDYEVGYRRPPRQTQFQPGRSGNPIGRPKGAKNLKTDLLEELNERILVREGGAPRPVTKQRAMLKSLMIKAVKGDTRAAALLLSIVYRLIEPEETEVHDENLAPDDLAILDAFIDRAARRAETLKPNGSGSTGVKSQ